MYYTNLLQALLSGAALDADQTLLFVTSPTWMANVSANQPLNVSWALGRQQRGVLPATMRLRFRIGEQHLATVVPNAREGSTVLDLSALRHTGRSIPCTTGGGVSNESEKAAVSERRVLTVDAVGGGEKKRSRSTFQFSFCGKTGVLVCRDRLRTDVKRLAT